MTYAIVAQAVGKRYSRYHNNRPRTMMEAALAGYRRMRPIEQFWALRQVGFAVRPGQMLGVIGHNGAGKSTLLQILSGVVCPDEGRVQVHGRMGALLDLGASFHPDLTGRENVFVSAIVSGLTHREVQQRFDQIVEFAELSAFIDNPVRTYSTGMQMRLAFAVAIHNDPDILLVDEFLSVGDVAFQSKCLTRIGELKSQGCAVVLISHNVEQMQQLCDQALWLEDGRVREYGDPNPIASQFMALMSTQNATQAFHDYSRQVEVRTVRLWDRHGHPMTEICSGDPITIELEYCAHQPMQNVIFSISISDQAGQIYFNTNTATPGLTIPLDRGNGQIKLHLDRLDLRGGSYYANAGIFAEDWSTTYDYHWHTYPFQIQWTPNEQTLLYPPRSWEIRTSDSIVNVELT
ncbi:MAG: ABC transporter ATP-binding protein [Elainella sp. Prado103]|jgi:lipopolysaccharide transport system ATP-binding protein|nr:ABC transporter ATP-binding protein [Elainella sp. Prado103]